MNLDLGIIIPFRGGDSYRVHAFDVVMTYWEHTLPDARIYVGDEDDEFGNFSRSRSRNAAVEKCDREFLLIADADVVCASLSIVIALAIMNLDPNDWYIPYEYYVKLNEEGCKSFCQTYNMDYVPTNSRYWEAPIHKGSRASLNLVRREQYYNVRGFDERFVGWSAEDQAFTDSLECLYGEPQRTPGVAAHLWHPTFHDMREGHKHYPAGMALWDRYKNAMHSKDEMMKIIQEKRELN